MFLQFSLIGQVKYFPPLTGDTWDTIQPSSLGWCAYKIEDMNQFLEAKDTKAFIILKDGKIVVEKYFGSFAKDSVWYWASAGKSIASFLVGMAEEKGILKITDKTSKYLGKPWTSLPEDKEDKITIWHQLTMTSGFDDDVVDKDCTVPSCLTYKADAGSRWAYHNATYLLTHDVVAKAHGNTFQNFMNLNLSIKTGITGLWVDYVLYSKPRNMARFGLLMLNNGTWDGKKILSNQNYLSAMTKTSQNLNQAYGLLWWLNGKQSFMLPGIQTVFNNTLIPNAPNDMYCALGKNDQKIYVIPSQNMVVIRMGNDGGQVAGAVSSFDNLLWEKIKSLPCTSSTHETKDGISVFPNPFNDEINIKVGDFEQDLIYDIFSSSGKLIKSGIIKDLKDGCIYFYGEKGIYF